MNVKSRNSDGTFAVESKPKKARISLTLDSVLAKKLKKFPNLSQFIEQLLFESAANNQLISIDWDYWDAQEALQDLRLTINHCLVKLADHEERNPQADGEFENLKAQVFRWLQSQNYSTETNAH